MEWDSKTIRLCLASISFEYEKQLKKANKDSNKLRDLFFMFFNKNKASRYIPTDDCVKSISLRDRHDEKKRVKRDSPYIIYDLDNTWARETPGWTIGDEVDDYLMIYVVNGKFYQQRIECSVLSDWDNYIEEGEKKSDHCRWYTYEQEVLNFKTILLNHQLFIRTLCEDFGYETVIKCIKNDKTIK